MLHWLIGGEVNKEQAPSAIEEVSDRAVLTDLRVPNARYVDESAEPARAAFARSAALPPNGTSSAAMARWGASAAVGGSAAPIHSQVARDVRLARRLVQTGVDSAE